MKANFVTGILEGALAAGWSGGETAFRRDLPPGSIELVARGTDGAYSCLRLTCPCGCGSVGTLPFWKDGGNSVWNWDGNHERPTLTPSIQFLTPCKWHGYLKAGEFERC